MINYLKRIQNVGVDSNTDPESAKRIKLANTISIIGIGVGLIVLFFAYLFNLYFGVKVALYTIIVVTFIAPILNHYRKTIASRIVFLFIANMSVISMAIITGKQFHFQYYLLTTLCMPLVFLVMNWVRKGFFVSDTHSILYLFGMAL